MIAPSIPARFLARFLARWPTGAVDQHELPLPVAGEFAAQLRAVGCTIVWAPLPVPVVPPKGHSKAERRLASAQQRPRVELGEAA
jgi:hypothetical protein